MSQENVELVRKLYELTTNLREVDPKTVDRVLRDYADDYARRVRGLVTNVTRS